MILLDTNAVLYHLHGKLGEPLPDRSLNVSVITEIELLGFPDIKPHEVHAIEHFLKQVMILDISSNVKREAIRLRQTAAAKLPDAIIAATAIAHGLELWTNDSRFAGIPGVQCRTLKLKNPS